MSNRKPPLTVTYTIRLVDDPHGALGRAQADALLKALRALEQPNPQSARQQHPIDESASPDRSRP